MAGTVDLPRIQRALANLDRLAKNHPELKQGGAKWGNNLDALESAIVGTPAKDRVAAYKKRLHEKGYKRVTIFLAPAAQAKLEKLIAANPGQSIGEIVSDVLIKAGGAL